MLENDSQKFVFVLGREKEIALEELKAVLSCFDFSFDINRISGNLVYINLPDVSKNDLKILIDKLAGSIKIFRIIDPVKKDIASQITFIFEDLKKNTQGKINFGISYFGKGFTKQNINSIALKAKKQLKNQFSLRYVEARDSLELSSILSLKNNMLNKGIEFGLFDDFIGVLVALNNPEEWSKRDYGKPAGDKFSGMLPPKLARMMVNIALSSAHNNTKLIVDPFCGSGNILLEAAVLGYSVIGSDISEKAVKDSDKNLKWLKNEYDFSGDLKVFLADATSDELLKNIPEYSLMITEPFLGRPKKFKPSYSQAIKEYSAIKDLYLKFLSNLTKKQFKDLTFCLVFPLVETFDKGKLSIFSSCVDEIKKMGYTQIRPILTYGRDYQVVKREIVFLKK